MPMTASPPSRPAARTRLHVVVRGAVQGVGFRPFVHRNAGALGLAGWVANSGDGVVMEIEGRSDDLTALLANVVERAPPNAAVTAIESREIPACGETRFCIRESLDHERGAAQVPADLATCDACLADLLDPADRRYLYPFTTCTHCGPRYSLIEDLPYDRERTAMRRFPMCEACRAEYDDPLDRRFHAQSNACARCGPRLELWDPSGARLGDAHEALLAACRAIRGGLIVAVKGIGGFQLLADALSETAVRRLRSRKRRAEKPLAVLCASIDEIREHCRVSPPEEALLCGPERPIVLLARDRSGRIAQAVAPGAHTLGVMLPCSPLHHLLMRELGFPVVATSGNLAGEPIAIDEHEALRRLAGIADLHLIHDRPILRPVDDSVTRVAAGRELILRRARGYAPTPLTVTGLTSGVLAVGGQSKTTVGLTAGDAVILSQHIGDQETTPAREAHARALADLARLHRVEPRLVSRDLHPDYATTRAAQALGLPALAVPHHLAHVVACVAENRAALPVLGIAWDGSGYGTDGSVWGGEFLLVGRSDWQRVAHLRPFRLPGGEAAVREPRRPALGLLYEAFGVSALEMTHLAPIAAFTTAERNVLRGVLARGVNAPATSSAGRLFDAFAALAGLCQRAAYEGQAAMQLEGAAGDRATGRRYPFPVRNAARGGGPSAARFVIDWQPALEDLLRDLTSGVEPGAVSEALHNGLAAAIAETAGRIGERRVVLTGGCFQNARLTEAAVCALRAAGHEPIWHQRIPPNDGGIALGQAVWAAWTERHERETGRTGAQGEAREEAAHGAMTPGETRCV